MEKDKMRRDRVDPDNPPLTDEQLAAMRPATEVEPDLVERARRRGERGPQKAPTKELVSMRLDRVIVEHFRSGGPGWQTRVNEVLKKLVQRKARTGEFVRKTKLAGVSRSARKAARRR